MIQTAGTTIAASLGSFLGKHALSGAAAGVFAEDPEAVLHVRQPRINAALGIDYDRIAGRYFPQSYFGLPAQLWRDQRPAPFLDELEQRLRGIANLRLLTLDNAAVLYSGDENSRPEVTAFVSALNGLADRLAAGIILSAHPSKSQDGSALRVTSGTTAWVNACRSVLELKGADDQGGPSLKVVKANHATTGTTIPLAWRNMLLVPDLPDPGIVGWTEKRKAERVFLDLLDKTTAEGRHVSDARAAGNYAPRRFAHRPETWGCKVKDFEAAMEALFAQGAIVVTQIGRKGHEVSSIVRVGGGGVGAS